MVAPPSVLPEGLSVARGTIFTPSRITGDAHRVAGSFLRDFDPYYGYLIKNNKPRSKGKAGPTLNSAPASARVDRPAPLPVAARAPARVDRPQSSRPYTAQRPVTPEKKAACSRRPKKDTGPRAALPRRRSCSPVESPRNRVLDLIEGRVRAWAGWRDDGGS